MYFLLNHQPLEFPGIPFIQSAIISGGFPWPNLFPIRNGLRWLPLIKLISNPRWFEVPFSDRTCGTSVLVNSIHLANLLSNPKGGTGRNKSWSRSFRSQWLNPSCLVKVSSNIRNGCASFPELHGSTLNLTPRNTSSKGTDCAIASLPPNHSENAPKQDFLRPQQTQTSDKSHLVCWLPSNSPCAM